MKMTWNDVKIEGEVTGMSCEPVCDDKGEVLYSKYTVIVVPPKPPEDVKSDATVCD